MPFEEYWDEIYKNRAGNIPKYDNWLEKYLNILNTTAQPILDLGCGQGNDTLYLTEKGFKVIACDYSKNALEIVNKIVPQAQTMLVDISKKLPFKDGEFKVVIADLCLHYFDKKTTIEVMRELKRILQDGGYLFARVNSINDKNHGAGQGKKIEENYYFVEGYNKRFFNTKDVNKYFSIIGEVEAKEKEMLRYEKPKKLFEIKVKKV